jgi:hypothetical protein
VVRLVSTIEHETRAEMDASHPFPPPGSASTVAKCVDLSTLLIGLMERCQARARSLLEASGEGFPVPGVLLESQGAALVFGMSRGVLDDLVSITALHDTDPANTASWALQAFLAGRILATLPGRDALAALLHDTTGGDGERAVHADPIPAELALLALTAARNQLVHAQETREARRPLMPPPPSPTLLDGPLAGMGRTAQEWAAWVPQQLTPAGSLVDVALCILLRAISSGGGVQAAASTDAKPVVRSLIGGVLRSLPAFIRAASRDHHDAEVAAVYLRALHVASRVAVIKDLTTSFSEACSSLIAHLAASHSDILASFLSEGSGLGLAAPGAGLELTGATCQLLACILDEVPAAAAQHGSTSLAARAIESMTSAVEASPGMLSLSGARLLGLLTTREPPAVRAQVFQRLLMAVRLDPTPEDQLHLLLLLEALADALTVPPSFEPPARPLLEDLTTSLAERPEGEDGECSVPTSLFPGRSPRTNDPLPDSHGLGAPELRRRAREKLLQLFASMAAREVAAAPTVALALSAWRLLIRVPPAADERNAASVEEELAAVMTLGPVPAALDRLEHLAQRLDDGATASSEVLLGVCRTLSQLADSGHGPAPAPALITAMRQAMIEALGSLACRLIPNLPQQSFEVAVGVTEALTESVRRAISHYHGTLAEAIAALGLQTRLVVALFRLGSQQPALRGEYVQLCLGNEGLSSLLEVDELLEGKTAHTKDEDDMDVGSAPPSLPQTPGVTAALQAHMTILTSGRTTGAVGSCRRRLSSLSRLLRCYSKVLEVVGVNLASSGDCEVEFVVPVVESIVDVLGGLTVDHSLAQLRPCTTESVAMLRMAMGPVMAGPTAVEALKRVELAGLVLQDVLAQGPAEGELETALISRCLQEMGQCLAGDKGASVMLSYLSSLAFYPLSASTASGGLGPLLELAIHGHSHELACAVLYILDHLMTSDIRDEGWEVGAAGRALDNIQEQCRAFLGDLPGAVVVKFFSRVLSGEVVTDEPTPAGESLASVLWTLWRAKGLSADAKFERTILLALQELAPAIVESPAVRGLGLIQLMCHLGVALSAASGVVQVLLAVAEDAVQKQAPYVPYCLSMLATLLAAHCSGVTATDAPAEKDEGDGGGGEGAERCKSVSSGGRAVEQHWYHCHSCGLRWDDGCCSVCAKLCHRDHDIAYSTSSSVVCDCVRAEAAAVETGRQGCLCRGPEDDGPGDVKGLAGIRRIPLTVKYPELESFLRKLYSARSAGGGGGGGPLMTDADFLPRVCALLDVLVGRLDMVQSESPQKSAILLSVKGKEVDQADSGASRDVPPRNGATLIPERTELVQPFCYLEPGTLEVKLSTESSRGRQLKALIVSNHVRRNALAADRRGRIAYAEAEQVVLASVVPLLMLPGPGSAGAEACAASKHRLCVLARAVVSFQVLGLAFDPRDGNYLAIWGLRDCMVLALHPVSGAVQKKYVIESSFDAITFSGVIKKVQWVPGSSSSICIVTDTAAKIFDFTRSINAATHCFRTAASEGTIVDAVLVPVDARLAACATGPSGAGAWPVFEVALVVLTKLLRLYVLNVPRPSRSRPTNTLDVRVEVGESLDNLPLAPGMMMGEEGAVTLTYSEMARALLLGWDDDRVLALRLEPASVQVQSSAVLLSPISLSRTAVSDDSSRVSQGPFTRWVDCSRLGSGLIAAVGKAPRIRSERPLLMRLHGLSRLELQELRTCPGQVSSCGAVEGMCVCPGLPGVDGAAGVPPCLMVLYENGSLQFFRSIDTSHAAPSTLMIGQPGARRSAPLMRLQALLATKGSPSSSRQEGLVIRRRRAESQADLGGWDPSRGDAGSGSSALDDAAPSATVIEGMTNVTLKADYVGEGLQSLSAEAVWSKLSPDMEDDQLVGARPEGLSVAGCCRLDEREVALVRFLAGGGPADRMPRELWVMGRSRLTDAHGTGKRWYDVPLTEREIAVARQLGMVFFGATTSEEGHTAALEAVELHARPRRAPDQARAGGRSTGKCSDETPEPPLRLAESSILVGLRVLQSAAVLGRPSEEGGETPADEAVVEPMLRPVSAILSRALVAPTGQPGVQALKKAAKGVLASLFPSRSAYLRVKDRIHLERVKQVLERGGLTPGELEAVVTLLYKLAVRRPMHLHPTLIGASTDVEVTAAGLYTAQLVPQVLEAKPRLQAVKAGDVVEFALRELAHVRGLLVKEERDASPLVDQGLRLLLTLAFSKDDVLSGAFAARVLHLIDHTVKRTQPRALPADDEPPELGATSMDVDVEDSQDELRKGDLAEAQAEGGEDEEDDGEDEEDDGDHDEGEANRDDGMDTVVEEDEEGEPEPGHPETIYRCDGCDASPLQGVRWHCDVCPDFDLCQACYTTEPRPCPGDHGPTHSMRPLPLPGTAAPAEPDPSAPTTEAVDDAVGDSWMSLGSPVEEAEPEAEARAGEDEQPMVVAAPTPEVPPQPTEAAEGFATDLAPVLNGMHGLLLGTMKALVHDWAASGHVAVIINVLDQLVALVTSGIMTNGAESARDLVQTLGALLLEALRALVAEEKPSGAALVALLARSIEFLCSVFFPSIKANSRASAMLCQGHQKPAARGIALGEKHKGRAFYVCSMPSDDRCKFFRWADDGLPTGAAPMLIEALAVMVQPPVDGTPPLEAMMCDLVSQDLAAVEGGAAKDPALLRTVWPVMVKTELPSTTEHLGRLGDILRLLSGPGVLTPMATSSLFLLAAVLKLLRRWEAAAASLQGWDPRWRRLLCQIITESKDRGPNNLRAGAKKMLRCLHNSRAEYQQARDVYVFSTSLGAVMALLGLDGEGRRMSVSQLPYPTQVKLHALLNTLKRSAAARPATWRVFCMSESFAYSPEPPSDVAQATEPAAYLSKPPLCALVDLCSSLDGDAQLACLRLLCLATDDMEEQSRPAQGKTPGDTPAAHSEGEAKEAGEEEEEEDDILPMDEDANDAASDDVDDGENDVVRSEESSNESDDMDVDDRKRRSGDDEATGGSVGILAREGKVSAELVLSWAVEMSLGGKDEAVREATGLLLRRLWRALPKPQREEMLRVLVQNLPFLPAHGGHAREVLLLLEDIAWSANLPSWSEGHEVTLARSVVGLLQRQLEAMESHPHADVFRRVEGSADQLSEVLQALPSDPCPSCLEARMGQAGGGGGGGDAVYKHVMLESLKLSQRSAETARLVLLKTRQCVKRLSVKVHEPHGRYVKRLALYSHHRIVASLADLPFPRPDQPHPEWELLGAIVLDPGQTAAEIDLTVPIVVGCLALSFEEFHPAPGAAAGASGASGPGGRPAVLHCLSCGRQVTDAHGVCRHCGEVAFQCRQCRHINYERFDAFLCVECGFCAYGQFGVKLLACPAMAATPIRSEVEWEEARALCEEQAEALAREQQRLAPLLPPLRRLLLESRPETGARDDAKSLLPWLGELSGVEEPQERLGVSEAVAAVLNGVSRIPASDPTAASGSAGRGFGGVSSQAAKFVFVTEGVTEMDAEFRDDDEEVDDSAEEEKEEPPARAPRLLDPPAPPVSNAASQTSSASASLIAPPAQRLLSRDASVVTSGVPSRPQMTKRAMAAAIASKVSGRPLTADAAVGEARDPRVQKVLDYFNKTIKPVSAKVASTGREMVAIWREIQIYRRAGTASLWAAGPGSVGGGEGEGEEGAEVSECWECGGRVSTLLFQVLLPLVAQGRCSDTLQAAGVMDVLMAALLRSGRDDVKKQARRVLRALCASHPPSLELLHDLILRAAETVMSSGMPSPGAALKEHLDLVHDLCSTAGGEGPAEVEVRARHCQLLVRLLRHAAQGGETSGVVSAQVLYPVLCLLRTICSGQLCEFGPSEEAFPLGEGVLREMLEGSRRDWAMLREPSEVSWATGDQQRAFRLAQKVVQRWRKGRPASAPGAAQGTVRAPSECWLLELLLDRHSVELRREAAYLLLELMTATSPPTAAAAADVLVSGLSRVMAQTRPTAGEAPCLQVLGLLRYVCEGLGEGSYLSARCLLPFLCSLTLREQSRLKSLETRTLAGLSRGHVKDPGMVTYQLVELIQALTGSDPRLLGRHMLHVLRVTLSLKLSLRVRSPAVQAALACLEGLLAHELAPPLQEAYLRAAAELLGEIRGASHGGMSEGQATLYLLRTMTSVVSPPRKQPRYRVHLRRAPSQEEFFRGALAKNPVWTTDVPVAPAREGGAAVGGDGEAEPTMRDLRSMIARELGMADAVELLELLVLGKIIQVDLSIRVVFQSLWQPYVAERHPDEYGAPDMSPEALPPMIVTYRLAGVDGEATEEVVESLADGQGDGMPAVALAEKYRSTAVMARGPGLQRLLEMARPPAQPGAEAWEISALTMNLIKLCTKVPENRSRLMELHAPGTLLSYLLSVLHWADQRSTWASSLTDGLLQVIEDMGQCANTTARAPGDDDADCARGEQQVAGLMDGLSDPSLVSVLLKHPALTKAVGRLLPSLTYGQMAASRVLGDRMLAEVPWASLEALQELSEAERLRTNLILESLAGLAGDASASSMMLREVLLQNGFTRGVVEAVKRELPETGMRRCVMDSSSRAEFVRRKESVEGHWERYLARPALLQGLRVLGGLAKGHRLTQALMVEEGLLALLHDIEEITTSGDAGSLAEVLLETVSADDAGVAAAVEDLRRQTRDQKKRLAQQNRDKALQAMGIPVSAPPAPPVQPDAMPVEGSGQQGPDAEGAKGEGNKASGAAAAPKASVSIWMAEMEGLEEEAGLSCMVCQEGYSFKPKEVLGLYIYSKGITGVDITALEGDGVLMSAPPAPTAAASAEATRSMLDAAMSRPTRRSCKVVTSVTAFNLIHFSCHAEACKADRALKQPKSEWDGAALRNSRVSCNGMLPLRGPHSMDEAYRIAVEKYFARLASVGQQGPLSRFSLLAHDLRLLLLRLAFQESLRDDCGGGSLTRWVISHGGMLGSWTHWDRVLVLVLVLVVAAI